MVRPWAGGDVGGFLGDAEEAEFAAVAVGDLDGEAEGAVEVPVLNLGAEGD